VLGSPLLTLGDVLRECAAEFPDVRLHQLKYAIASYRIEERQRAGVLRLWHPDDLPQIKSALRRIAGRREVAHAG
jgi:hypothetical protein